MISYNNILHKNVIFFTKSWKLGNNIVSCVALPRSPNKLRLSTWELSSQYHYCTKDHFHEDSSSSYVESRNTVDWNWFARESFCEDLRMFEIAKNMIAKNFNGYTVRAVSRHKYHVTKSHVTKSHVIKSQIISHHI